MPELMTIGEVAERSGVAASALRFYEDRGLINSERAGSGHRRYPRPVLRRIAFIVFAQRVGLTLEEIGTELAKLPPDRAPTRRDWSRLSSGWTSRIDERIAELERLKARADGVHRLRLPVARPLPARPTRVTARAAAARARATGSATGRSTDPGSAPGQHRLDERRRLACHTRARHDALEAGLLGAPAHVLLDVRVEAEPRHPGLRGARNAPVGLGGEVDDEQLGLVPRLHRLVTGGAERALELRAEQQIRAEQGDAGHGGL